MLTIRPSKTGIRLKPVRRALSAASASVVSSATASTRTSGTIAWRASAFLKRKMRLIIWRSAGKIASAVGGCG